METKLKNISRQYRSFVDDQVLTSQQLNEFLDYFEDQDRLSRVLLTGTGIICGFELKKVDEAITISQGIGITTDGDLLFLDQNLDEDTHPFSQSEFSFKHFRKLEDKHAQYPWFKGFADKTILLYELVFPEAEGAEEISTLDNWTEMGVVLYLESYKKQKDLCTTHDCDNQGVEQINRVRLVLVDKDNFETILKKDKLYTSLNIQKEISALPIIAIRRNIITHSKTQSAQRLKNSYTEIIEEAMGGLGKAIGNLYRIEVLKNRFENIFQLLKKELDHNFQSSSINRIIKNIPNITFQHYYEQVKDLALAWNELRAFLIEFCAVCLPDISSFPKHLLLGKVNNPDEFRHRFYKSIPLSKIEEREDHIKSLLNRFYLLITNFSIPKKNEIKITPSTNNSELGKKAIPFYYDVRDKFLDSWNPYKTQKNNQRQNLSYHSDKYAILPQIKQPLEYDLDRFDFLRIEGHQGKNYKVALDEILELKKRYGLDFDVKALPLSIEDIDLNMEEYAVQFEDLNLLLQIWTDEQNCILKEAINLLTSFNIEEPGRNDSEKINRGKSLTKNEADLKVFQESRVSYDPIFNFGVGNVFSSYNAILRENISNEKDTLGVIVYDLPMAYSTFSAEELTSVLISKVNERVDDAKWKGKAELREMAIEQPLQLFSEIILVSEKSPTNIKEVSNYGVWDYEAQINSFCKKLQKIKDTYQKPNDKLPAEVRNSINLMITQLSGVCCSAKKLKTIQEKIEERKRQILLNLTFHTFAEKHPGVEHKAGVKPGGTFILVYLHKAEERYAEELNKAEEKKIAETFRAEEIAQIRSFFDKNEISRLVKAKKEKEVDTSVLERKIGTVSSRLSSNKDIKISKELVVSTLLGRIKGLDDLPKRKKETDIPVNTVFADFSLSYRCCSDQAPVNFVIQKPPATLQLEKDEICLGNETIELPFIVTPADGDIQPDREIKGMQIKENRIVLNPSEIQKDVFGETIRFTVDQQVTSAELTIFKAPEVDFTWEETENENEFRFEISTEHEDIDNWEFLWDFGDGHSSDEKTPVHHYETVNEATTIVVSLQITPQGGNCPGYVEKEIIIEPIEVKIDLDKKDFCKNDSKKYPFIINPKDAKVKINGSGVVEENGKYFFVPSKVDGKNKISFMINGKDAGLQVNVHPFPNPGFDWKQEGNNLLLKNKSQNADSVRWYINGQEVNHENENPFIYKIDSAGSSELLILLMAENKYCGTVETSETIKIKRENEEENHCIENTGRQIEADYQALIKMKRFKEADMQKLLTDTTELYKKKSSGINGVLDNLNENLKGKNNLLFFDKIEILFLSTHHVIQKYKQDVEKMNELKLLLDLQLALFNNLIKCQKEPKMNSKEAAKFKAIMEVIRKINSDFNSKDLSNDPFKKLLSQDVSKMKMKDLIDIVNKNRNIFK